MIKKIDLSGITAAPKSARSAHPVIQFDGDDALLLEQWAKLNPQFKTLKNQTETLARQLAPRIKAAYFTRYNGITPESSTMLVRVGATTVKLTVKDAYSSKLDSEDALVAAIGPELAGLYFRQTTVISLDLDKVPEDKQSDFADAVIALAQKMGATDAISAKQCIKPRAGFHEARTTLLSPEQNERLDEVLPITAYPQI